MVFLWPSGELPSVSVDRLVALMLRAGVPWRPELPPLVEVVSNVLIMVPLALLGRLLWPRLAWWGWTLVGFGISASVELTQALVLADRSPSVVDLAANTLGAAIGAALVPALAGRRRRRGTRPRAARPHDHEERTT